MVGDDQGGLCRHQEWNRRPVKALGTAEDQEVHEKRARDHQEGEILATRGAEDAEVEVTRGNVRRPLGISGPGKGRQGLQDRKLSKPEGIPPSRAASPHPVSPCHTQAAAP